MENELKIRGNKVGIGCLIMDMITIGFYYSIGIYMVPISKALGVSIGAVSLIFTVSSIGSIVASMLIGKILAKIPVKALVVSSGIFIALFFASIGLSSNIYIIYFTAILYGLASILSGQTVSMILITWWIKEGKGKVIGSLNIGIGMFGIFMLPIIASLIEKFGIRNVAVIQGVIGGVIVILVSLFLLSEHPRKYGLVLDPEAANKVKQQDLSIKDVKNIPAFWMIIASTFLFTFCMTGYSNSASAFYQTRGFSAVSASLLISVYSGARMVWSVVYGAIVDKSGPGKATAILGLTAATMFFASLVLGGWVGSIILAGLVASVSISAMMPMVSFPKTFSTTEVAGITGLAHASGSIGGAFGVPIAGFIYDSLGSYNTFMILCGVFMVCAVLLNWNATSKKTIESIKNILIVENKSV